MSINEKMSSKHEALANLEVTRSRFSIAQRLMFTQLRVALLFLLCHSTSSGFFCEMK